MHYIEVTKFYHIQSEAKLFCRNKSKSFYVSLYGKYILIINRIHDLNNFTLLDEGKEKKSRNKLVLIYVFFPHK